MDDQIQDNFIKIKDRKMMDLFQDIVTINEEGKSSKVHIIWAEKEKIVRLVKLPVLGLTRGNFKLNENNLEIYYELGAKTSYEEDMNQILEQVITKFSHWARLGRDTAMLTTINKGSEYCIDMKIFYYSFNLKLLVGIDSI